MSIITNFECTNISWRSVTLSYSLSEKADDIYIYKRYPVLLNGSTVYVTDEYIFTSTDDSYLSGGERVISELHSNFNYRFRLKVVKDGVSTYSDWISVKTLNGATSINVNDVDIDSNKIVVDIENVDMSNIVLELHLYTKSSYDGNDTLHTSLEKEIGSINGSYTWLLTDDEKEEILSALKYGTSSLSTSHIIANSYVPGEEITGNRLTHNSANILITLNEDIYKPIINSITSSPDSKTLNILSDENYLIQGVSSVTTTLSISNITIGTSAGLYSIKWIITTPSGNTTEETVNYSSQTTFEKVLSSSQIYETGVYTISCIATDTRGLASEEKTFTYNSLSYHRPIIYAKPVRPLRSNGAVSLEYKASYSRLAISGEDKNSVVFIKYGYAEITESLRANIDFTGYSVTDSSNNVDKEISLTNETWLPEGSVDTELNYRFVFILQDKYTITPYNVDMVDGKPIMRMLNNGQISIGMIPNTSDDETLLFVNSDIQAIDPYGEQRKILDTVSKMIQLGDTQPDNQMIGGLWLQNNDYIKFKTGEDDNGESIYTEINLKTNATLVAMSDSDDTTVSDKINSINEEIENINDSVEKLENNTSGFVFRRGGFQVTCEANSTVSHNITFDGFTDNPFIYLSLFTQGTSNQKYITATTQIENRSATGATINISNSGSVATAVQCGWMAVGI